MLIRDGVFRLYYWPEHRMSTASVISEPAAAHEDVADVFLHALVNACETQENRNGIRDAQKNLWSAVADHLTQFFDVASPLHVHFLERLMTVPAGSQPVLDTMIYANQGHVECRPDRCHVHCSERCCRAAEHDKLF